MADFAAYWPRFPVESGRHGKPVTGWLTSREWWVRRMREGDRLWLFICGEAWSDDADPGKGYLAAVLLIQRVQHYRGHDPGNAGSPRFLIACDPDRCFLVEPPLLIDEFLRRPDGSKEQHIGLARQTPLQLGEVEVARLLRLLRRARSAVAEAVAGMP